MIPFLLSLSSMLTVLMALQTVRIINRHGRRATEFSSTSQVTPTVSVCVAARNETHALAHCLERIIASDYPKLEILVLDDSSSDDTSLIIKSFAHAGVRFIAGKPLPQGWLGKNHAYQTLADEASGDILLFLDVDTILASNSISRLVNHMQGCELSMLSVLPQRHDGYRMSALLGTLRYYWESLLSSKQRPPTSSALWMIIADELRQANTSLQAFPSSVKPERHIAKRLTRDGQYGFLLSSAYVNVAYEKRLGSQHDTALRLYFPLLGHSKLLSLVSAIGLCLLGFPFLLQMLIITTPALTLWAAVLVVLQIVTFGVFTINTYKPLPIVLRSVIFPLLLVREILLLLLSVGAYTLGRVSWKGRPVRATPVRTDSVVIDS